MLHMKVLAAFKDLHKARLEVFQGDEKALKAGQIEINQQFRKNLHVKNPEVIEELISVAQDSVKILRQHFVQIEQVGENQYRANITKDTYKLDNTEYRDVPEEEILFLFKKEQKTTEMFLKSFFIKKKKNNDEKRTSTQILKFQF